MKSTITSAQVAEWLRETGHQLIRSAELVERSAALAALAGNAPQNNNGYMPPPSIIAGTKNSRRVTPDEIRAIVSTKQRRAQEVAMALGVDKNEIIRVVSTPGSGLERSDKGWVREKTNGNGEN